MGKKEQNAVCVFGSALLLKQLQALEKDLEAAAFPSTDIEPIHRLRVTSRRLRTSITHFRECLPKKKTQSFEDEIRRLTRALGNARDLDIQIETLNTLYEEKLDQQFKPGYRRLLLRLKQSRMKAQKKVSKTLSAFQQQRIITKMRDRLEKSASIAEDHYLFTPSLYEHAYSAINADLDNFFGYEKFVQMPDNMEKLHAMRIAGKHLRYSMEIFAPLYKDALFPHIQFMKELQNQLGRMHDDDVWVNWLPKFLLKEEERVNEYFGNSGPLKRLIPGIEHLIEDRKRSRESAYNSFLTTWESLDHEKAWDNLRGIIKAPLSIESAMNFLSEEKVEVKSETVATQQTENHNGINEYEGESR